MHIEQADRYQMSKMLAVAMVASKHVQQIWVMCAYLIFEQGRPKTYAELGDMYVL